MPETLGMRSNRISKKAAFLGLAACFVFLEILLRVFPFARLRLEPQYFYRANPSLGWEMTPGIKSDFHTTEYHTRVEINSQGFRGTELAPKTEGHLRVLGLGGSFTFGYGVDTGRDYLSLLQKYLDQKREPHVEVLNWGVPGYSFSQNFRLLKERGPQARPDLILMSFAANDLNASLQPSFAVYDGYLVRPETLRDPLLRPKLVLFKYVKTFHFLAKALESIQSRTVLPAAKDPFDSFGEVKDLFRELARFCRENHMRLAVIFIPHRSQVHPDLFKAGSSQSVVFNELNQKLAVFCQQENIIYIDLLPGLLEEAGLGKRLYYHLDAHWNTAGHAAAARILAEELPRRGLLSAKGFRT